jgi:hypothetical protein
VALYRATRIAVVSLQLQARRVDTRSNGTQGAFPLAHRQGSSLTGPPRAQARLLDNMNEDVDRQHLHVRALKRRVTEIIKKSSGNSQLVLIGCLVLVLIILTVFAFN